MSYCRWSSDDFQCDVYVYEDVGGGWTTHVAARRYVFDKPLPEQVSVNPDNFKEWYARQQAVSAMLKRETMAMIGLPHDGASFNDGTPGECADRLESLRAMGYRVPQDVIDTIRRLEEESDARIKAEARAEKAEQENARLRETVAFQACDDGLWLEATTAAEAYLQHELSRLHALIERSYVADHSEQPLDMVAAARTALGGE